MVSLLSLYGISRHLLLVIFGCLFAIIILLKVGFLSKSNQSEAKSLGSFPLNIWPSPRIANDDNKFTRQPPPVDNHQENDDDDDDYEGKGQLNYENVKKGGLQARPSRKDHAKFLLENDPTQVVPKLKFPAISRTSIVKHRPTLFEYAKKSIEEAHKALVKEYLAPWKGLDDDKVPSVKVTQRMLATMEFAYKGGSFRVRIAGGRLYYRKLVHWKQTYRTQRMLWYLRFIYELVKKDRLLSEETLRRGLDFVIYVGDGAKVAADTFTTEAGFPLFSLRTSLLHVDIPIPDPVQHGSNGNYKWSEVGKKVPWKERKSQLVFRGRGSCLKMQADNWHFCNRVRLQQLANNNPDLIDAGIIQWNQLYKASRMTCPPATVEEVEKSTGLKLVPEMSFNDQSGYKYIIDVDGGLGSSRKPGILSSGSLLFAAESPWYTHYEPLLEPYRDYIPIDRWLRGLVDEIKWARDNDNEALSIMESGRAFERKFLTIAASKNYMAILLNSYSELLAEPVLDDSPIEVDYCETMGSKDVAEGPMGCTTTWLLYNGHDIPDEIVADKKR